MDEGPRSQIDAYLPHLDLLIRRGRGIRDRLASEPSSTAALEANRVWQQDCGVAVNQLSGGSKAHWLARSFSEAFLMRAKGGRVVEAVAPAEIVDRLVEVLEKAVASLSRMGEGEGALSDAAPTPRRFEFVHNLDLRPVVEQAYVESRSALEQSRYDLSLLTTCGILEAIVTDALEHKGLPALATTETPPGTIADWSFETRLAVAERAGLIRGGCARLPPVARRYRDPAQGGVAGPTVSEREARQARQVLHVVMRDLDPGR